MEIKNIINKISKNNQGSIALLMTMIVLTSILTVVLTASEIIRNGLVADKTQLDSTKAYFIAEAAAERILWHVRVEGDDLSVCADKYIDFNSNFDYPTAAAVLSSPCSASCTLLNSIESATDYKYCIKYETTLSGDAKFTNYGDYYGSRRAVEIIF